MSHFSGHHSGSAVPQARAAFFGCSLVAVSLLGFYSYLNKRHQRKFALDAANENEARISSWEYRMLQRGNPVPSSDSSPTVLRSGRIEARSTPLSQPVSMHNPRHRTVTNDTDLPSAAQSSLNPSLSESNGRPLPYAQPTAQKGHSDGRTGVYTKNPGWHEAARYAANGKAPDMGVGDGAVDGEARKMQEMVEKVEDGVKSAFGK